MNKLTLIQMTQAHRIQSILQGRQVQEEHIKQYLEDIKDSGYSGFQAPVINSRDLWADFLWYCECAFEAGGKLYSVPCAWTK